ncbi:lantibiotic immunity ABC transporter MutG family permease subunit [Anoxybacillus kestanbolensis]|uniref:lantibiotic immunity ABC transporter MutG family permease subunit n=1 Tax=Anoxybacillus kestanbolensis TaxID=227476 RepID=UPI00208DCC3E|nr:lantibiotic immunity ABC transporter MutG family permease subunit [Anoxybacillus kestanbolensis]MCL9969709.1 lantibiotic immunity ABC transporter MutG family permease subunit [Anoxybacillus kestanbolensis]
MSFLRLLSSEWIKTKRTAIRMMVIITPIIYSPFMVWYFSHYRTSTFWQMKIYQGFFEVMAVSLPIIISLLTGLMSYQEEKAGSFMNILTGPVSKVQWYVGKLTLLIFIACADILLATILMLFGMKYVLKVAYIHYQLFLQGAMLSIVGSLILFSLHLFISFAFGMGSSIAVGIGGFLISALIGATSLGDHIWSYIPWAWAVRLSQFPILMMPEVKQTLEAQLLSSFSLSLWEGIAYAILSFIVVTIISSIWFHRWEGNKPHE